MQATVMRLTGGDAQYPLCDVFQHFGADGFLYLRVFVHGSGGAMLKQVVQSGIYFGCYPFVTAFRCMEADGIQVRLGIHLRVFLSVQGERSEEHTSELQSRQYLVC